MKQHFSHSIDEPLTLARVPVESQGVRGGPRPLLRATQAGLVLLLFVATINSLATSAHAVPANDNFANAQTIYTGSTITGTNVAATAETSEPGHSTAQAPYHSVWYKWVASTNQTLTVTTRGSDFDTVLSVYTGASVSTLTRLASNDDEGGIYTSSSTNFSSTAGTTYYIAIDGYRGYTGNVTLLLGQYGYVYGSAPATPGVPVITSTSATSISGTAPAMPAGGSRLEVDTVSPTVNTENLTPGAPFTITRLQPGSLYTLKVKAYDATGSFSSVSSNVTATTSPDRPAFGTVTASSVAITAPTLPTGSTWKLQRASGTATVPALPTTGLQLWLKADAITGVSNCSPLAAWPDSSGHVLNATQSGTESQPAYIANDFNGRAAVRFDGIRDFLALPNGFADYSAGITAYVVSRPLPTTLDASFFDLANGPGVDAITLIRNAGGNLTYKYGNGSTANSIYDVGLVSDNEWQIHSLAHNLDKSIYLGKNGHPVHEANFGLPKVVDRSHGFIGKSNATLAINSPDQCFGGDIAEVLIYNSSLTIAQQQSVQDYLSAKYGIGGRTIPTGITFTDIQVGATTGSTYTDTGRTAGQTYWYRYASPTTGGDIAAVMTAPAAPGLPTFTNILSSSVTVVAPATLPTGANSLILQYKKPGDTNFAYDITNLAAGGNTLVNGLVSSTAYPFRFEAVASNLQTAGSSASSTTAAAVTGTLGAPVFGQVYTGYNTDVPPKTDSRVTVIGPILPAGYSAMRLEYRQVGETDDPGHNVNIVVASGLGSDSTSLVTGLHPGFSYTFRFVGTYGTADVPGLSADITIPPLPQEAPGLPTFSNLTTTTVTVQAPDVPRSAQSLTLQVRPENTSTYTTVAQNLGGGAQTDVTYPTGQANHYFRYLAVRAADNLAGMEIAPTTIPQTPAVIAGTLTSQSALFADPLPTNADWGLPSMAISSMSLQKKLSTAPDTDYADWFTYPSDGYSPAYSAATATGGATGSNKAEGALLAPGTTYTFRWRAIGPAGTATGPTSSVTTLAGTQPAEPGKPTFTLIGSDRVTVTAPSTSLTTLRADHLKLQQLVAGIWTDAVDNLGASAVTPITALTGSTLYTYRYVAVATGLYPPSTAGPGAQFTTNAEPPIPGTPTIGASTSTSIVVTLPLIQSSAQVASLTLQYKWANDPTFVDWTPTQQPGGTVFTVTGLTAARTYLFQVVTTPTPGHTAITGPAVAGSTTTPAPSAPGAPQSITALDPAGLYQLAPDTARAFGAFAVDVLAPATLPANANSLTLQMLALNQGSTYYVELATGIAAGQTTKVSSLSPGISYRLRYLAVGPGGSTAGASFSPDYQLTATTVNWMTGDPYVDPNVESPIRFLIPDSETVGPNAIPWNGIRQPAGNITVSPGTPVNLTSYTAYDWDQRDFLTNGGPVKKQLMDTCLYYWNVKDGAGNAAGTFLHNTNLGQAVRWTAPAALGDYSVTLTITDQDGANKGAGDLKTRNDPNRLSTEATTGVLFKRTITVH